MVSVMICGVFLLIFSLNYTHGCGNEPAGGKTPDQWFLADGNGSSLQNKKAPGGVLDKGCGIPMDGAPGKDMDKRNAPRDEPRLSSASYSNPRARMDDRRPDVVRENSREIEYERALVSVHGHEHDSLRNYGGGYGYPRKNLPSDSRDRKDRNDSQKAGDYNAYRDVPANNRSYTDDTRRPKDERRGDGTSRGEDNYPRQPQKTSEGDRLSDQSKNSLNGQRYPNSGNRRIIHRIVIKNKVNCPPCPLHQQCPASQQFTIPQTAQVQGNNPYFFRY